MEGTNMEERMTELEAQLRTMSDRLTSMTESRDQLLEQALTAKGPPELASTTPSHQAELKEREDRLFEEDEREVGWGMPRRLPPGASEAQIAKYNQTLRSRKMARRNVRTASERACVRQEETDLRNRQLPYDAKELSDLENAHKEVAFAHKLHEDDFFNRFEPEVVRKIARERYLQRLRGSAPASRGAQRGRRYKRQRQGPPPAALLDEMDKLGLAFDLFWNDRWAAAIGRRFPDATSHRDKALHINKQIIDEWAQLNPEEQEIYKERIRQENAADKQIMDEYVAANDMSAERKLLGGGKRKRRKTKKKKKKKKTKRKKTKRRSKQR